MFFSSAKRSASSSNVASPVSNVPASPLRRFVVVGYRLTGAYTPVSKRPPWKGRTNLFSRDHAQEGMPGGMVGPWLEES